MKIRIKLWLLLAGPLLLVVAQGWVGWHLAADHPGFQGILLGLLGLTVLALLLTALLLAKLICQPLEELLRTARRVTAGKTPDPLPLQFPGELRDLAAAYNQLLEQLQRADLSRAELEQSLREHTREFEHRLAALTTELCSSEQGHHTILANLPGMAFRRRYDYEWNMDYVSEGCRLLLGTTPETLTAGQPFAGRIHPEDRDRVWREVQSALSSHDFYAVEYRLQHASGQWRSVCERGWTLPGLCGQINGIEGHITDLTWRIDEERNRRIMEGRLRRAQKMEAIGTLAGGVAHNFNNVLAGILGSAELMRMDIDPTHPAREFLDQIFVAGQRAREMVQQVLTLSQWRENERILIQLQPLVRECVKLLRATIPAMVDISSQVDPACPAVLADPTQIHQVVMNLCTNVWQTLPEKGGQIRVNLARCQITETLAAAQPGLVPGPGIRLTISDQSDRLNQFEPERLFEPLSPHPSDTEDRGLSLSVVHGIVKSHQGVFTLKSEPGHCAHFHVYLPAQGFEMEPPVESPTVLSSNHERILLVDDDDIAGLTTEKILHRFGYRVKWFKHPEIALADFQDHPGEYDFLLTDLAMPGMTGNHLAAAVRRLRPAIPILIITGMIDPAILKEVREAGFGNVLFKPVSPAILSAEIARRLGHPTH